MVCEAVSGYICNMEIYAAEGKKLQDTVLSLLEETWATITTCIKIIFIIV